jgi:hypothetical protein
MLYCDDEENGLAISSALGSLSAHGNQESIW